MICSFILISILSFEILQMFTQLKGRQRVQPAHLLTHVYRLKAICHRLMFALKAVIETQTLLMGYK